MSYILCETDASGGITAYYIHGPMLVGRIAADGSARYYHTNAIGSVIALTDDTGSVTDQYAYTPFGEPVGRTGTTANPFTYVGGFGVMAEDDGLCFMRARFYDPDNGRFLGKDPLEGTLNNPMSLYRYNYATSNPLVNIDPDGKEFFAAFVAVGYAANVLAATANFAEAVWNGSQAVYYGITGNTGKAQSNVKEYQDNLRSIALPSLAIPYAGAIEYVGSKFTDEPFPLSTEVMISEQITPLYNAEEYTSFSLIEKKNNFNSNVPAFYDHKLNVYYVNGQAKNID